MSTESDKSQKAFKWTIIRFFGVLAACVVAVAIGAYLTKGEAKESKTLSQATIDAIVKSCEENGNPLREVQQNDLKRQIAQAKNRDLYRQLFPDADPIKLDALIDKSVRIAERELKLIEPVDCEEQYPDK